MKRMSEREAMALGLTIKDEPNDVGLDQLVSDMLADQATDAWLDEPLPVRHHTLAPVVLVA